MENNWMGIAGFIISIIVGVIAIYPQLRRVGTQNKKDQIEALKVAMELAGMSLEEQLELRKEVKMLKDMLQENGYELRIEFYPANLPHTEKATVKTIRRKLPKAGEV